MSERTPYPMTDGIFLRIGRYAGTGLFAMAGLTMAFSANNASAADVIKGGQIYGMHCAACHGANGVSVMPGAPNFARNERMLQPDIQLMTAIKMGRNAMPAYIGILQDRDVLDVIAYLRTMRQ
jgi:cytochrome c6